MTLVERAVTAFLAKEASKEDKLASLRDLARKHEVTEIGLWMYAIFDEPIAAKDIHYTTSMQPFIMRDNHNYYFFQRGSDRWLTVDEDKTEVRNLEDLGYVLTNLAYAELQYK